jgi:hypothetical protein
VQSAHATRLARPQADDPFTGRSVADTLSRTAPHHPADHNTRSTDERAAQTAGVVTAAGRGRGSQAGASDSSDMGASSVMSMCVFVHSAIQSTDMRSLHMEHVSHLSSFHTSSWAGCVLGFWWSPLYELHVYSSAWSEAKSRMA